MKGTQRSRGNTCIQDPESWGGGYDDKKPEMKARGFHLVLSMLMFKSRWGLLLNQKNKISCELTTCSERRVLWGRVGPWGSQEGELKGPRWPGHCVSQQDEGRAAFMAGGS